MATVSNKPLSNDEVIQTCLAELYQSRTYTSEIQTDRELGLRGYNQMKYGDEQEGQSQIVASDIKDTVESILPDLVEVFVAGDNPVEFEPVSMEDVPMAEAETDAVRYVYNQQNEGFLNTYALIKDTLLSKNCYAYVCWGNDYRYHREEYQGLSEDQMVLLSEDQDVEIQAVAENMDNVQAPDGSLVQTTSYDVICKRKHSYAQCYVHALPPERVWINRYHASVNLDDARCVIYEELVMESDLIEEGYDPELIKTIPSYQWFARREEITRWRKEGGRGQDNPGMDESRRIIQVLNCYVRLDRDGDGVAELLLVRIGSENSKTLLEIREIDDIPIVSGAAILNQHKHYAIALADNLQDIQQISTVLKRQMLNNVYFANFNTRYLEENAMSENTIDDLLSPRPAGIVRVKSLAGIRNEAPLPIVNETIAALGVVDTMRGDRTGISRDTQGLNPDVLADSTNMVGAMIMSRSQARVKMMARILAETIFKHLMLKIHETLMKHGSPFPVRRNGVFQMVNPREWTKRERMLVQVGTGFTDNMEKMSTIENIIGKQTKIIEMQGGANGPLVNLENVFASLQDWSKLAKVNGAKYFSDPKMAPPPAPPPPDPQLMAVQVANKQADAEAMKKAADAHLELQKQNDNTALEREKIASNHYLKARELELKYGAQVNEEPDEQPAEMEASDTGEAGQPAEA